MMSLRDQIDQVVTDCLTNDLPVTVQENGDLWDRELNIGVHMDTLINAIMQTIRDNAA